LGDTVAQGLLPLCILEISVSIYVNLMPIYFFNWTAEIVEHLADNDVTPEEFEMVVQDDRSELVISRSTGRPARIGVTDDGRILFCVFDWIDDEQTEIEPRTAYEIDP
jgi:hypothetical protein